MVRLPQFPSRPQIFARDARQGRWNRQPRLERARLVGVREARMVSFAFKTATIGQPTFGGLPSPKRLRFEL